MRTTLNIDDDILKRASELTGAGEKTALVQPPQTSAAGRTPGIGASGGSRHMRDYKKQRLPQVKPEVEKILAE